MAEAAETRAALEMVCERLHHRRPKTSYMDAECLRRAKHDDPNVMPKLWAVVVHLLELTPGAHEKCAAIYCLSALGYPRSDQLRSIALVQNHDEANASPSCGSRELLLAFAFLLDELDLISFHGTLASYPPDISHVEDKAVKPPGDQSTGCENTHVLLQVYTKWKNEIRRLQQLDVHRLEVLQRLQIEASQHLSRAKANIKPKTPPTQYELFVLERPAFFAEHIQELECEIEARSSKIRQEELFWRWMGSVLKAANGEAGASDGAQSEDWTSMNSMTQFEGAFSSNHVLESMETFMKSWQLLEQRKGQPLPGTAQWGDLREHWETHKMLPQEVQTRLKAQLRSLGASFDQTLPSPWLSNFVLGNWLDVSPERPNLRTVTAVTAAGSSSSSAVADLRERYAQSVERHRSFRSLASQKLEAALAEAAREVFVKWCRLVVAFGK